jgi:hypothetical protein
LNPQIHAKGESRENRIADRTGAVGSHFPGFWLGRFPPPHSHAPPTGVAGQFFGSIFASHYGVVIFGVQTIGGVLLLLNRFVPLALVILGPVIVNVFFFHALMAAAGLPLAIVVVVLWAIVANRNKQHLAGIFVPRTE